ncbi:MAG: glycosyltransferase family 9 protein [Candidatus Xenobia bacterium]
MARRVLIVHARGGVGDVVCSTPVLEAVRRGWPDASVTMLVRRGAAGIVEANPFLDDRLVVEEGTWDHGTAFRRLIREVRVRQFDVGMVLWNQAPEAWLLRMAGIPVRVGQAGRVLYSFNYTHPVKIRSDYGDSTSHWVDIQLDYARALDLPTEGLRPCVRVPQHVQVDGLLEGLTGPRIGFAVGKGLELTPTRWPVDAFAAIADRMAAETGATIVLTGSPQEAAVVEAVATQMQAPRRNLAGRTSLLELAAVIARCDAFVCPDSGPMHVAAALDVPTVGLFAMRHEWPERWRPYGSAHTVVRPEPIVCPLDCRKETCPRFPCYRSLDPGAVAAAVQRVMRHSSPGTTGRTPSR